MKKHILLTAAALICLGGTAMAQDAANGEKIFAKCKACHQVGDGAKNGVGPTLNGVIGRKAGTGEGFKYSAAMIAAGAEQNIVWTVENIDKYLENPRDFIKNNKMAFVGLKKPEERADVIEYLKKFSPKQ